ncbi:putative kinesin family protein [Phaeomoniella chlamydospora]|uniref:Kinesin-like protein n=1 Tax=Phaeomoniella chlamydospora TaxID=158046 RepID=A0A0G2F446_PHACM|nr:putative kinesin family protein [Phaeomoniella chlamydospora]
MNKPSAIPEKTVRKTISIAAFPQPPTAGSRPTTASSNASGTSLKPRLSEPAALSPGGTLKKKRSRLSTSTVGSYRGLQTPSLLNASGEGKSIPSVRTSGGQYSIPSPSQSRSSSAQGSYSTSATTFEDTDDVTQRAASESGARSGRGKVNKGNVVVSVRVRPDAAGTGSSADGEWMVDGRRSLVAYRGKEGGDYFYDNVFAAHDNNAKVYDASAKRLVRRVMEGYHGTVFAYGMTGTGKTFSMQGTATNPGVIPLAITDIFSYIRETPHREFLLRVSYLEIYNEKIHDLLSAANTGSGMPGAQQEEIKIREDPKRGVYATPLKEEIVQSPTQLLRVIARGDHARRTGSTQFNARSSRSHAVVQIIVESRERGANGGSTRESKHAAILPGGVRVSTLSLIDLAGSERAAESKERRTEGAHINKSLLTLGTVIARLSTDKEKGATDKDGKHLPYRDSKLTRLLQPALSGNSLVSILCTIQIGAQGSAASANTHTGETINTLKFAARAKNNIVSHAKRAEEAVGSGANAGLLERYRAEIQTLRSQLDTQQKAAVDKEERQLEKEAEQRHEEQMLEMQLARTALKERIEHLNRLILCSKSTGVNSTSGTVSALGMHGRLSGSTNGDLGSRSIRSSASQSTLGAKTRVPSMVSVGNAEGSPVGLAAGGVEDEEETGEYGDGVASLQAQNRALQSDLQDKNRYIATLEKRLLQARRSSHSRMSMGFSHKGSIATGEDAEMSTLLQEKDATINDLRARLEDKERMVTALRSAARKRDVAELAPEEHKKKPLGHMSSDSNSSSQFSGGSHTAAISPIDLLSPQKKLDKPRRNVDEVSRMLDELIQDKVESGHLMKSRTGSMGISSESRRVSIGTGPSAPTLGSMVSTLRDSVVSMRQSVIDPDTAISSKFP